MKSTYFKIVESADSGKTVCMSKRALLALHLASLALLVPGLFLPVLKIDITASFFIDINLFNESRSVIGTLGSLWDSGAWLAFILILLFGLLVPLSKSVVIFYLLLSKAANPGWQKFVETTSKWAMADVFAVSIFVAFLGSNAMKYTRATLEAGFYFFSAYVLMSAVIVSLLSKLNSYRPTNQA